MEDLVCVKLFIYHMLSVSRNRNSPKPFLRVCRTFWMHGKVGASEVVAYTNDGYLGDAYG
jgi:hypothetical protein